MKAIMVMFDSLNRRMLEPYGCEGTQTPNFRRLAERATTFDNAYVCSMPCMPARRDLHTGRPNFLHCPWSPLQPFDVSVPEILNRNGVYTHLSSDHYHYWEDGGATYHNRYGSWDFARGQEGDMWIGQVHDATPPPNLNRSGHLRRQDWINRPHMNTLQTHPQSRTFSAGLEFIERNRDADNWFLQIECFDPHEPFFSPDELAQTYPTDYEGPLFDWPSYGPVTESPEEVRECRRNYATLLALCDAQLGRVLDAMDEGNMWEDTLLMVWTDHGFLLGEHNCWAKNWMPLYQEVAHTPFFMWDPRHPAAGERRSALVQPAIDLGPTLLSFFGQERAAYMTGHDLAPVLDRDEAVREAAMFGYFGRAINITDGRYMYMRQTVNPEAGLNAYTLMPTVMRGFVGLQKLAQATLAPPFEFTAGCPLLKLPQDQHETAAPEGVEPGYNGHYLYDLQADYAQMAPIHLPEVEARLTGHLRELMLQCEAPAEQFTRVGLLPGA